MKMGEKFERENEMEKEKEKDKQDNKINPIATLNSASTKFLKDPIGILNSIDTSNKKD